MSKSAIAGLGVLLAGVALAATSLTAQAQEQTLQQSVSTQQQIVKNSAQTQKQINNLADSTQALLVKYMTTEKQIDQLKKYNDNLQGLIDNQQSSINSLQKQLGQLSDVAHGIVPLMQQMIAGLDNFIKLDVPYQLDQREQTVEKLKDLMTDSDVSISERYRQIMGAYQNELQAGRTIDAYRGQLTVNNKPQTVDFLRIGRVVLCYQTLDQSQTGCWDQRARKWQVKNGFRRDVANGLKVARKETSPSLLILPVLAPVAAQQQTQQ
jgi:septal ring factor EnvC (AmiA/AmiB activator)